MKNVWIIVLLVSLVGCQSNKSNMAYGLAESSKAEPSVSNTSSDNSGNESPQSKIIRTAVLTGDVDEIQSVRILLAEKMNNYKSFIADENESHSESYKRSVINIKVENKSFEPLLSDLQTILKKTTFKQIKSQDVSAEHIDITTRLSTKRKVMKRYEAFLNKAVNIEEILDIENQIRIIQEEIESADARLRYMDNQIQWSTITMTINQEKAILSTANISWLHDLKTAFQAGWNGLLHCLVLIVYLWPWMILIAVFYLIGRRKKWFRRRLARA